MNPSDIVVGDVVYHARAGTRGVVVGVERQVDGWSRWFVVRWDGAPGEGRVRAGALRRTPPGTRNPHLAFGAKKYGSGY